MQRERFTPERIRCFSCPPGKRPRTLCNGEAPDRATPRIVKEVRYGRTRLHSWLRAGRQGDSPPAVTGNAKSQKSDKL
jgi:hypothetical protein